MDMLVNLYLLPEDNVPDGIRICRALPPDTGRILDWVGSNFGVGWRGECMNALSQQPAACYIALRDRELVGFACFDATARGYFGPIGVAEGERGTGIGKALLTQCLCGMREAGYGYAVIGWCDEAQAFYRRTVGAFPIPDSEPENTIYGRLCRFS